MQTDGKRLLACSTASQLGYVVTAFGLGFHAEALYLLAFCCCNKAFTFI
jgi:NADH:ubiquinone oxidoreductase subunit 5 (subunit L)/multisubunit Na+/H+ antiporter MnhA subunit